MKEVYKMKKALMILAVIACFMPSRAMAAADEHAVEIPVVVSPSLSSVLDEVPLSEYCESLFR